MCQHESDLKKTLALKAPIRGRKRGEKERRKRRGGREKENVKNRKLKFPGKRISNKIFIPQTKRKEGERRERFGRERGRVKEITSKMSKWACVGKKIK